MRTPLFQLDFCTGSKALSEGNEMSLAMASSSISCLTDRFGFDRVTAFCGDERSFEEAFGAD